MRILAIGSVLFALSVSSSLAQEGDPPPPAPYSLMLTVHTPGRQPDQHRFFPQTNLKECWEIAEAFVDTKIPDGALGISAACGKSITAKEEGRPS